MNRGSILLCTQDVYDLKKRKIFTKGRNYRVKAGKGDGDISRSDGRVGAFILSDDVACLTNDIGDITKLNVTKSFDVVEETLSKYPPRKPVTHVYKPIAM